MIAVMHIAKAVNTSAMKRYTSTDQSNSFDRYPNAACLYTQIKSMLLSINQHEAH